MKANLRIVLFGLVSTFTLSQAQAMRWYSPSTGRWFSRDPIAEPGFHLLQSSMPTTGTYSLARLVRAPRWRGIDVATRGESAPHAFVMNDPVDSFDILGLAAGGGGMQVNCRQPCEDFRRTRYAGMEPVDVPNGAIVCCGGVKFICTWGADKEKNQKAREIARRCLRAHEGIHLPSVECDQCSSGPTEPRNKKKDKAFCEEEVAAYGVGKSCFEAAISECGTDQACIDSITSWIQHEDAQMKNFQNMCKHFK